MKRSSVIFSFVIFVIALAAGKFSNISEAGGNATVAPNITATKTVSLFTDNDSDGKADPGDTLQYNIVIKNAGADSATGVVLNDTLNLSTISGAANIVPVARNDSFNTIGNVNLAIPDAAGDLLSNDSDYNGGALTITGFGNSPAAANGTAPNNILTTTNSDSLLVRADGSFDYNPPRGGTATETFFTPFPTVRAERRRRRRQLRFRVKSGLSTMRRARVLQAVTGV